jgi:hypothetical protein
MRHHHHEREQAHRILAVVRILDSLFSHGDHHMSRYSNGDLGNAIAGLEASAAALVTRSQNLPPDPNGASSTEVDQVVARVTAVKTTIDGVIPAAPPTTTP